MVKCNQILEMYHLNLYKIKAQNSISLLLQKLTINV